MKPDTPRSPEPEPQAGGAEPPATGLGALLETAGTAPASGTGEAGVPTGRPVPGAAAPPGPSAPSRPSAPSGPAGAGADGSTATRAPAAADRPTDPGTPPAPTGTDAQARPAPPHYRPPGHAAQPPAPPAEPPSGVGPSGSGHRPAPAPAALAGPATTAPPAAHGGQAHTAPHDAPAPARPPAEQPAQPERPPHAPQVPQPERPPHAPQPPPPERPPWPPPGGPAAERPDEPAAPADAPDRAAGEPDRPAGDDRDAAEVPPAAPDEPEPSPTDPERLLAQMRWRFDPDTLREIADDPDGLRSIRDALTAKVGDIADNPTRARLLSLRAVVSRILGDLQQAQADGKLALAHAEATGELRRIAIVRARLAHVLLWRGEFAEADRLFALANSSELPARLRATMHQHAGKSAYEQGRYIEACNHFEKALDLRRQEDPELIAATELALDAVFRRVAAGAWGPYPRTPEEILQVKRAPVPTVDDQSGLWGYADPEGGPGVPARYADVQPFRDGVAWVLSPGVRAWHLIDESGGTLIAASHGYRNVGSFSDGMAWVSKDGGRWIGVDKAGSTLISTGYQDVRPFRGGLAAVCRDGRWGAVDAVGRVVVPCRYDGFATALSDGRYIDGFSDEGLAVVRQDGRAGVLDRSGRVLVEPVHPALVIHPVAFLVTDGAGRWGALDRRGGMLVTPSFPSRDAVDEEIDRLLADTRPVL